ncbi:hypothetical protein ZWY2020_024770 [Hordeum vulgare]|nr:hypothetical protein ZWY2020_024770 [Hordeum vulgare]
MAPLLKVKKLSDKVILPSMAPSLSAPTSPPATTSPGTHTLPPSPWTALTSGLSTLNGFSARSHHGGDGGADEGQGTDGHRPEYLHPGGHLRAHRIEVGPGAEALHRHGRRGDRRQLSGPVGIALFNLSEADFAVRPGDRVMQMIVHVIATPEAAEVKDLDATLRGDQGKRHQTGRKRAPS